MRVQRKVVRREIFSGLIVERVVQQDRAQDRALGLHADGQAAFQAVVGGCHLSLHQFSQEVRVLAMPNEVRCRTRKQISFEKLCEVVDYGEESSTENNLAAEQRTAGPSARPPRRARSG